MKIEGPNRTSSTSKTDKAKKTGGTSGASFSDYLVEPEGVEAAKPAIAVSGVGLFTALQAAEHATDQQQRRQALMDAKDLLDELEELQMGLLLGTYTTMQLRNLNQRLNQQRLILNDPKLMALLDDIQLRAAVELAKYE